VPAAPASAEEVAVASTEAPASAQPAELAWLAEALRYVRPTLLAELDYRVHAREVEGIDGFGLGRLRTGLVFDPAPWMSTVATIEWAGEHPMVLDVFATLRAAEWLDVNVGWSKTPLFASFRYEPVAAMPFSSRSPVVNAFRVRRDVGVEAHLAPREVPIEAVVRVGNGSGSVLGNDTPLPAGYALVDLVLGRPWRGAAASERELGLRIGAAALVESVRDRDGIVGTTPLGFIYRRPIIVEGLRVVGEAHVIGYAGPLRLTIEGALAEEGRSRDDDGNPSTPRQPLPSLRSSGLTAELAWVLLGEPRRVGVAPAVPSPWAGGALEVAARFDALWLGWGAGDVTPGGSTGGALAVKWWPVDFLAATLEGYVTRYDVPPVELPGEHWSWGGILRLSLFTTPPARAPAIAAAD
jgi:phosphate-selective porin OprO/OprP